MCFLLDFFAVDEEILDNYLCKKVQSPYEINFSHFQFKSQAKQFMEQAKHFFSSFCINTFI